MDTYFLVGYKEQLEPQDKAASPMSRKRSKSRRLDLTNVHAANKKEVNWKRTDAIVAPEFLVPTQRVSSASRKSVPINEVTTEEERRRSSKGKHGPATGGPVRSERLSTSSKSKLR